MAEVTLLNTVCVLVCVITSVLQAKGNNDGVTVTIVIWYRDGQDVRKISVDVTETHHQQFYQCLCTSQTSSCTMELHHKRYRFIYESYEITHESNNQTDLHSYECNIVQVNGQSGQLQCRKQLNTCGDPDKYQYLQCTNAELSNVKCVGITSYSGQIIIFNTGRSFEPCEIDCPNTLTTSSVAQTPIANKTEPLTQKETNTDNKAVIIVGVILSLIILTLLIVLCICLWRIKRRARKTPNKNSQSSNLPVSFHNSNTGYENTVNIHDEGTPRNDQVSSTDIYSTVDSRNSQTNNKRCPAFNSAIAVVASASSGSSHSVAPNIPGMTLPHSSPTVDSASCRRAQNKTGASLPTGTNPDTPNANSKLHGKDTKLKNPYDVLLVSEEPPDQDYSLLNTENSSDPTNDMTEYSMAQATENELSNQRTGNNYETASAGTTSNTNPYFELEKNEDPYV